MGGGGLRVRCAYSSGTLKHVQRAHPPRRPLAWSQAALMSFVSDAASASHLEVRAADAIGREN
ncbi:hypothetical protein HMPREF0734_00544 [Rothia dentocariosa M567]|jgi:hypothetical protein|nr:hypothetical protein HMPREF0734_00544 [Rothia dentocariosa M567]